MSILITQNDIDYAATNGLTVQIDDVVITSPTDWNSTSKLSVNIDNGVIIRIEIPSDPFGSNSVKPIIAPDSRSASFDYNYYEGSIDAYVFTIELDIEQPNSKGITDTYHVKSDYVRRLIKDKYVITVGAGSGGVIERDLSKYMLGLISVPFPISNDFVLTKDKVITLGKYPTEYDGDLLKGDILSVNVGDITTPKLYDNALAYQGKTAILHLPYTDSIAIDVDYVIGETISIRYDINLYDGFTVINISSSKLDEVVQTLYVDLDIRVPFANINYSQPPTGDPYNISIGGDNGVRQAFIEVLSYDAVLADGFFTVPITDEALIDTVNGFMTIDNIDLVSSATRAEKEMIIKQLEDGVIIKTNDVPVDPTDPPIEVPPNVAAKVTINGIVEVGQTLTSTITDPNGVSAEINYQWFDGTNIVGFADTYIVKNIDVGKRLKLTVTFTDNDGYDEVATSASTVLVPQLPPVNTTSSVAITGTVKIGNMLSAVITDANGVPSVVNYEWYAGVAIVGTSATYTIKEVDAEKQIYVKVSFTDNDRFVETATSAKTVLVPSPPPVVETSVIINGVGNIGEVLTMTATNSKPNNGYAARWYIDGSITSYDNTYTIKELDAGRTITAKASFNLVSTVSDVIDSTNSILVNTKSNVFITGINKINETLTANVTDINGVPSNVTYEWLIDNVSVNTQKTYLVKPDDSGKSIIVNVSFIDNKGYTETASTQVTIDVNNEGVNLWVGADDVSTFRKYRSATLDTSNNTLLVTSTSNTDTVGVEQAIGVSSLTNGVTYNLTFDIIGTCSNISVYYMRGVTPKIDLTLPPLQLSTTLTTKSITFTATETVFDVNFRFWTNKQSIGKYYEISNIVLTEV